MEMGVLGPYNQNSTTKFREITWIREDVVNAQKASLVAHHDEREKTLTGYIDQWRVKLEAAEQRAKAAELRLVPLQNILVKKGEEPAIISHVPRWAKHLTEACQGCRKARRNIFLQYPHENKIDDGCTNSSCHDGNGFKLRVPRTTHTSRKAASLAGKLKDTRKALDDKERVNKCLKYANEENARVYHEKLAAAEKMGWLNAASAAEIRDEKIAELEAKLKASVPLANTIKLDVEPRSEIESTRSDGSFEQKVSFWLPRSRFAIDPHNIALYKKGEQP
jgi:hypothetical protein